jgi:hypothetical protein
MASEKDFFPHQVMRLLCLTDCDFGVHNKLWCRGQIMMTHKGFCYRVDQSERGGVCLSQGLHSVSLREGRLSLNYVFICGMW